MLSKYFKLFSVLFFIFIFGCSSTSRDNTKDWSASQLYTEAKLELNAGNYETALSLYLKLSTRYPFGIYAQQAQLEVAYAHWKNNDSGLALAAIERYLKLYPNQIGIEYALYLKGLINFNDNKTLFSAITGENMAERDAEAGRVAFAVFKDLITKYPKSIYAEDSLKRMQFLLNVLAENEVHIARFYLRKKAYHAALNRSKSIISNFQGTPATEEALAIMTNAYTNLKLDKLASDSKKILKINYPESAYLTYKYDARKTGGLPKNVRPHTNTTWREFKLIDNLINILPSIEY